jgi:Spy/CpxP family protein refolding chaperone
MAIPPFKEKRMKLNRYLAALLAASSVAFALPAAAQRGPGGPGHHEMQGGGMRMLRGLELTAEQREQVSQIFKEQAPALRERANAAHAAHEALRKGALDPNADVRPLADAVGKAQADAALLRAETMRRVTALLTPEQRAKLEERSRERQQRRGRG